MSISMIAVHRRISGGNNYDQKLTLTYKTQANATHSKMIQTNGTCIQKQRSAVFCSTARDSRTPTYPVLGGAGEALDKLAHVIVLIVILHFQQPRSVAANKIILFTCASVKKNPLLGPFTTTNTIKSVLRLG